MATISGTITVQANGRNYTIEGEDFEVEELGFEERQMGIENLYEATYGDDAAGFSITISISEYPVGVTNNYETSYSGCEEVSDDLEIDCRLESDED